MLVLLLVTSLMAMDQVGTFDAVCSDPTSFPHAIPADINSITRELIARNQITQSLEAFLVTVNLMNGLPCTKHDYKTEPESTGSTFAQAITNFIQQGALINRPMPSLNNLTPLHYVIHTYQTYRHKDFFHQAFEVLLISDLCQLVNGETALTCLLKIDHQLEPCLANNEPLSRPILIHFIRKVLQKDPKVVDTPNSEGYTPLMLALKEYGVVERATRHTKIDAIREILSYNPTLDHTSSTGETALTIALQEGEKHTHYTEYQDLVRR